MFYWESQSSHNKTDPFYAMILKYWIYHLFVTEVCIISFVGAVLHVFAYFVLCLLDVIVFEYKYLARKGFIFWDWKSQDGGLTI